MFNNRSLIGIVLVTLGAILLLGEADVVDAGQVLGTWWPVVFLLAAGLAVLDRPPRPAAALVFVVIGGVLLTVSTGLLDAAVLALLWPAALIAVGLWIIAGRSLTRSAVDTGDAVTVTALFAGRELANASPWFEGGTVTAMFGGVELDLLAATPAPDARLDVSVAFGGVDITVPEDWRVLIDGPAIFGGYDSASIVEDPTAPTLRIRALVLFGGLDVKIGRRPTDTMLPAATTSELQPVG